MESGNKVKSAVQSFVRTRVLPFTTTSPTQQGIKHSVTVAKTTELFEPRSSCFISSCRRICELSVSVCVFVKFCVLCSSNAFDFLTEIQ